MFHGKKIVVVMPAYNAARTMERTYREIPLDICRSIYSHITSVSVSRIKRFNPPRLLLGCLVAVLFLFVLLFLEVKAWPRNMTRWYATSTARPAVRREGERQEARGVSTCCTHRLMAVYILMSEPTSVAETLL